MRRPARGRRSTRQHRHRAFRPAVARESGQHRGRLAGDGSFQIGGLRPGKVGLYAYGQAPALRKFTILRVERDGNDVTQTLELQPGQPIANLRVVLGYGSGAIRGTVRFENGTVPPDARLMVRGRREGSSNPTATVATTVDSRGRFVLTNLIAGTYELTMQMIVLPPSGPRPAPPIQQKQFVTVAEDGEVEVTFTVDLRPKEPTP